MAVWIIGAEATAPGANTQLIKIIPSAGKVGKVYAARITSQEVNAAGKVWRIRTNVQGQTVILADLDVTNPTWPILEGSYLGIVKGNGVDFFEMINVVAGTASTIHQAALVYQED